METTIKTSFNFAKEIQCNFITKNNPEHSYPGGLPEFITPYQSTPGTNISTIQTTNSTKTYQS